MRVLLRWVGMAVLAAGMAPALSGANAPPRCTAPEYRQFDFWLGDWDAFDVDNPSTVVARNHVDLILDGCVLREIYAGTGGLQGQSFTIYDASRKIWQQNWVTNRGELLVIEGKLDGDKMVLGGVDHPSPGVDRRVRGAWKREGNGVRETAERSTDGGKTWTAWFDIVFRPHVAPMSEDQKTVAQLDTQYQAAVKNNDAATMDRILADNFVLVTGSGKTYTKADLIDDARSGQANYEHNEDTSQMVRVWGDTAVVTAKLWEKGIDHGRAFDHTVWFSDTYVRTASGWHYVFGQSSLPLPKTP